MAVTRCADEVALWKDFTAAGLDLGVPFGLSVDILVSLPSYAIFHPSLTLYKPGRHRVQDLDNTNRRLPKSPQHTHGSRRLLRPRGCSRLRANTLYNPPLQPRELSVPTHRNPIPALQLPAPLDRPHNLHPIFPPHAWLDNHRRQTVSASTRRIPSDHVFPIHRLWCCGDVLDHTDAGLKYQDCH